MRKTVIHSNLPPLTDFHKDPHAATQANPLHTLIHPQKIDPIAMENHLKHKFMYFFSDFLRIASITNVTVPLNLYDERSEKITSPNLVVSFLKKSGPKNTFQFLQLHHNNMQLLRSGVSLLIVAISFLQRMKENKLDRYRPSTRPKSSSITFQRSLGGNSTNQTAMTAATAAVASVANYHQQQYQWQLQQQYLEDRAWILSAYSKILEEITIPACCSLLLIATQDAILQELLVHFIACLAKMHSQPIQPQQGGGAGASGGQHKHQHSQQQGSGAGGAAAAAAIQGTVAGGEEGALLQQLLTVPSIFNKGLGIIGQQQQQQALQQLLMTGGSRQQRLGTTSTAAMMGGGRRQLSTLTNATNLSGGGGGHNGPGGGPGGGTGNGPSPGRLSRANSYNNNNNNSNSPPGDRDVRRALGSTSGGPVLPARLERSKSGRSTSFLNNNNDPYGGIAADNHTTASNSQNNSSRRLLGLSADGPGNGLIGSVPGLNGPGNGSDPVVSSSCLAFLLSIAVLQKNRHLLLASLAEIMILLASSKVAGNSGESSNICELLASISTCPLPLIQALEGGGSSGSGVGGGGTGGASGGLGGGGRGAGGGGGGGHSYGGHGSGHPGSNNNGGTGAGMPINPLTLRIVHQAGIKVFLKFLQRYHRLLHTTASTSTTEDNSHRMSLNEGPSQLTPPGTGPGRGPGHGHYGSGNGPTPGPPSSAAVTDSWMMAQEMMSPEQYQEYHLVHHRCFLAICVLLSGAGYPSFLTRLLVQTLPGAYEVLLLSYTVYTTHHDQQDHLLQQQQLTAGDQEAANTTTTSTEEALIMEQQMQEAAQSRSMIEQAMALLQIEKQQQQRRQQQQQSPSQTAGRAHTAADRSRAKTASGAGVIAATPGSLGQIHYYPPVIIQRGQTRQKTAAGGGRSDRDRERERVLDRLTNPTRGGMRGGGQGPQTAPAAFESFPLGNSSGPGPGPGKNGPNGVTTQTLREPVQLAPTMTRSFEARYVVSTEKYALYLQNQLFALSYNNNNTYATQHSGLPASPLTTSAVAKYTNQALAPIQLYPSQDSLLLDSLQVMDEEARQPLLFTQPKQTQPQPKTVAAGQDGKEVVSSLQGERARYLLSSQQQSRQGGRASTAMATSYSNPAFFQESSSSAATDYPNQANQQAMNQQQQQTTAVNPYDIGLSATFDFFHQLPLLPAIPQRIEAKDAIDARTNSTDLRILRDKFSKLAQSAVQHITGTRQGVMRNGKSTVPINERAHRVYAQKMSDAFPMALKQPTPAAQSPALNGKKQQLGSTGKLAPLHFLSDDEDEDNEEDGKGDADRNGFTPATTSNKRRQKSNGQEEGEEDEEEVLLESAIPTPAWNPRPNEMGYYGIRFDVEAASAMMDDFFADNNDDDNAEGGKKKTAFDSIVGRAGGGGAAAGAAKDELFQQLKPLNDVAPSLLPAMSAGGNGNSSQKKGGFYNDHEQEREEAFQFAKGKIQGELAQSDDLLLL